MSPVLDTVKEWINPNWGRARTVPPMDTGLRPNLRLDAAAELLPAGEFEPDDVVATAAGLVFSSGNDVCTVRADEVTRLASFGSPVTALTVRDEQVIAAVEGRGLVAVSQSGETEDLCTDAPVTTCVTALATDGAALLATVGSTKVAEWPRALVTGDRSGLLVRVDGARAEVVAERLAWPSGVGVAGDEVLLSLSLDHRVEARSALGKSGRVLSANLPVYPGRVHVAGEGWWFAAPYVRNRVTELLLDEPALLAEMTETISPEEWFVPRLRAGDPFTDTMQMGQLRVLGVVKSWAPARSCGLVFRMDSTGRVAESAHARVDSPRHGVTGVTVHNGQAVAAARGARNLLRLEDA
ncbi:hypothetical protein F9C11_30120 [Amycolatopsis sp. VS8301801F10]|uniref:hypothetical protein n=1 Tax=Amycolatopsis sp. VS8301801F10 TaxID=2652442 RepID=UPI0038FC1758